jgi:uncharacterized protein (DUF433 family)
MTSPEPPIDWRDHVTVDPTVLVGKPVLRGTRISVELLLDLLAAGWSERQVLDSYPAVTRDGCRAALAYAADCVRARSIPDRGL